MRKLVYTFLAVLGFAALHSCSGVSGDSRTVMLPDTVKLKKAKINAVGNIAKYVHVLPETYEFKFNDSISEVRVLLKLKEKYKDKNYKNLVVTNPDSTVSPYPYLTIIDDMQQPIPGVVLSLDSLDARYVRTLLRGDVKAEIEVPFRGKPISKGLRDSVARYAATFTLHANYRIIEPPKPEKKVKGKR